jgi:hypothetical protein
MVSAEKKGRPEVGGLMNEALVKADLEMADVFAAQTAFKSPKLRRVACAILRTAMANGGSVWPDDSALAPVVSSLAGDDKNCVGTAWRWLGKVKLMERGGKRRRSGSGTSKGREIAEWRLAAWRVAETFLARNEVPHEPDQR